MSAFANGAVLYLAFGEGSAPTVVVAPAAPFGTGHVSSGEGIPNGSKERAQVPRTATHIAWISSVATGSVQFCCSEV